MATYCFDQCIKDVKPRPFDPNDIYLQFEGRESEFGAEFPTCGENEVGGRERRVRGEKREEVVNGREEFDVVMGDEGWSRFGCYVLVERFVLRRMDGSVVLTYDFKGWENGNESVLSRTTKY
ncbi:hypothetical protein Acr_29g0006380 [Actinidia rufa]|uniref:Uncharacterized protein n=1 Tax=Actinidia rufa TaxID=165716 RepID=A0A7J0HEE7_9ERIC|nr:hypothetical protein Acr_29g0006380 [Actinidia rufa]